MFGHLSAEDFTNLLDGAALTERRQSHLRSCARCREKFESVQAIRHQIVDMSAETEEFIPEPDWSEFRSDVRNALLSRSVRREYARGWLGGFPLKPALAWGISAALVFGLTITTSVLWDQRQIDPATTQVVPVEDLFTDQETINSLASMAGVSQTDVLDDVLGLSANEAESLQMILEDLTQRSVSQQ